MNKLIVVLLLLCAMVPGSAAATGSQEECATRDPQHSYTRDEMVVTLTIDLSRCHPWSPNSRLAGEMEQTIADTPLGESTDGSTKCRKDLQSPRLSGEGAARFCTLRLRLDHAQVDESTYAGTFTIPGSRGRTEIDFFYSCASLVVAACE